MSNLHLIKGYIDIFKNAVKVAGGDEKIAKENLTKDIFRYAKSISRHVFDKKTQSHLCRLDNLDVTNGFEDVPVAILTRTNDCFAINKNGDLYSKTSRSKYGFEKVNKADLLSLTGEQIAYPYKELYDLLREVVIFHKK